MASRTAEDRKWQRQNDADTLKRAAEIKLDKTRFNDAQKELKVMQKALNNALKKK
jgi:hypothetical protein